MRAGILQVFRRRGHRDRNTGWIFEIGAQQPAIRARPNQQAAVLTMDRLGIRANFAMLGPGGFGDGNGTRITLSARGSGYSNYLIWNG